MGEAEVSKKRADWDRLSQQISLLSAVSADLKQAHISLEKYLSTRDLYVQPATLSDKDLFDMYLKRKQSGIEKIVSTPQVNWSHVGSATRLKQETIVTLRISQSAGSLRTAVLF